ncbi:Na(+)/H(+) antiporter subunit B [Kaistia adipata]|uniref:Na(+)/H(+) antiporter subunit B n=1 Tax=Kaistia adipata TaxID=166954 RepID=UPI0004222A4D|nr:hydrogenase subunit MbhD domain-containing protein [Kaistia adipata]
MLEFLLLLVCASILAAGVLAVCLKNLLAAMVAAGLASLFAAVSFLLLAAPDVAMAEAAIGSGLATFIFLYAIRKTGNGKDEAEKPEPKATGGRRVSAGKARGGA